MTAYPRTTQRAGRPTAKALGWVVLTLSLGASGCATYDHSNMVAFLRAHEAEVAVGQTVVRPPDIIAIHAPGALEIDGANVMVASDGKITLRLLGEIDVAGLTTEEVANKIRVQLSRFYVEPEVLVEVSGQRSQYFYVLGQVGAPGPRPCTGRDTVLRALAEAGPTFLAWRSQIRVIRPSHDENERKTIIIDLDQMTKTGDMTNNVLLQPGDIVQVPPTPLAWVGLRIRELLYPVEPVLDAYTTPARVMGAHDEYDDRFGSDDDNRDRGRYYRR